MNVNKLVIGILLFLVNLFGVSSLAHSEAFYVISNKVEANSIVAFKLNQTSGEYEKFGEFETGGKGTGDLEVPALKKDASHPLANGDDPLISANALVSSADGKYVVAVNPGSATIALLRHQSDGSLKLINVAQASDKFPISVAIYGHSVVVASVGPNNMSGSIGSYKIENERLVELKNSRRDLKARPSTINFSSNGDYVIVDELVTGKIKVFKISDSSLSQTHISSIDSPRKDDGRFQAIPVGFVVKPGIDGDILLVSEARFLTPDFKLREFKKGDKIVVQSSKNTWQTGSVSTYKLTSNGQLSYVTKDALTGSLVEGGEIANCWVALSKNGKTLFAANALSSSISTFSISPKGEVNLKDATAYKNKNEELFLSDMALSSDGNQLYQLVGNQGQVLIFDIKENGKLKLNHVVEGLPKLGAYGMLTGLR